MKNITVTVDDDLYRRARVLAAEDGTTVSAVVKGALKRYTERETEAESRAHRLDALYKEVDAKVAAEGTAPPPEPGWREQMYEERFENSVLGRSLARRK